MLAHLKESNSNTVSIGQFNIGGFDQGEDHFSSLNFHPKDYPLIAKTLAEMAILAGEEVEEIKQNDPLEQLLRSDKPVTWQL